MKVWKLADLRNTNENARVITKEASWWLVGYWEVKFWMVGRQLFLKRLTEGLPVNQGPVPRLAVLNLR
jgi:hypothetical protein